MLKSYLEARGREKDILLMTHIVLGYPGFDDCFSIIESMVDAGVDMMELQIPFSEPIADGPVILRANQNALASGVTVEQCMDFAEKVSKRFDIPFLFMTYYNIVFKYGVEKFVLAMKKAGLQGSIIPDLPPEEGGEYLEAMNQHGLAPIYIFSPTTSDKRMEYIGSFAKGFVYCVARKGVTGSKTDFSKEFEHYLARCRKSTDLPIALGFGVKDKGDMDFLKGKADIAVVGSQTIRIVEKDGVIAVHDFIKGLR